MPIVHEFFKKLFCCGTDVKIELLNNEDDQKTRMKQLLLVEDKRPFVLASLTYFLAKNTHVLPMVDEVKVTNPNDFVNENYLDTFPEEFVLKNALPVKLDDKPTLVLDLDHTLVYPSPTYIANHDFSVPIDYGGRQFMMYFIKRPHLDDFLIEMAKHYELVLYTAGIMQYGLKVLRKIDSNNRIKYCLGRRYCSVLTRNGHSKDLFVKNMDILGRDLKRTIIVDDKEHSFAMHSKNGELIPAYSGAQNDTHLISLKNYLIDIKDLADFTERKGCNYK